MKNSYNIETEPFSPELVLEVIKDSYFQQCQYDPEAEPDIDLTFESTVDDWRNACDLVKNKPCLSG